MKLKDGDGIDRPAVTFNARKAEAKSRLNSLKSKGPPLGGAPEIPKGKLGGLMPQPDFEQPPIDVPAEFQPLDPPPDAPIGGVGAAYAVNQALASGKTRGPVSMRQAAQGQIDGTHKSPLSAETQELLQKVQQASSEEEESSLKEQLEDADEDITTRPDIPFDLEALDALRGELLSTDRRKLIESRLEPLKVEDLIVNREIIQTIPVIQNKVSYTLRTFSEREHIWCLKHVYNYPGSPKYSEELFNMFKITCSLMGMNSSLLPDHRKSPGKRDEEVDEDLFNKKYGIIIGYPVQLIADISVQTWWFNERITKLFSIDSLKNG